MMIFLRDIENGSNFKETLGKDRVRDDVKEKGLSAGGRVRPCYIEACISSETDLK